MNQTNIKYTTDGKKVAVVGNLNSQEKIVQEIFVTDNGAELPGGENFVVKSLLDAPARSWKEDNLAKIEERYENTYKTKERELEKLEKEYQLQSSVIKAKLSFLRKFEQKFDEKKFEQLINFISGDVKYIILERYGDLVLEEYDKWIVDYDSWGRFEALKLLSIFGRTDGDLEYRLHSYCDGSGGSTVVHTFSNIEDALIKLKELFNTYLDKNGLTDSSKKTAEKYKLDIPKDKLEAYREKCKQSIQKTIDNYKKSIEDSEAKLKEI